MNNVPHKSAKKRGFTLVELVIVIAVIAVLAAILIPTFSNVINNANKAKDDANMRSVNMNLQVYKTQEGLTKIDASTAYLWAKANGLSLTSKSKDNTYWFNEDTESFLLLNTEEALAYTGESTESAQGLTNVNTLATNFISGINFTTGVSAIQSVDEAKGAASDYTSDPGRLNSSYPQLVLLDERTDTALTSAVNGIRTLVTTAYNNVVTNAGDNTSGDETSPLDKVKTEMASLFSDLVSGLEGDTAVHTHLSKFSPANTVYISELGVITPSNSVAASNYMFETGTATIGTTLAKGIQTLVTLPKDCNVVVPASVGFIEPNSMTGISGSNLKLTLTNSRTYIEPGALSSTVLSNSGLAVSTPSGEQNFELKIEYTQKEAVYLGKNNDGKEIIKTARKTLTDTNTGLNGKISDYTDESGAVLLREYLIPSISFSTKNYTEDEIKKTFASIKTALSINDEKTNAVLEEALNDKVTELTAEDKVLSENEANLLAELQGLQGLLTGYRLQGVASVELRSVTYGTYVTYYGIAYSSNGMVLYVASNVGYITDLAVGAVNKNADRNATNGIWQLNASDPQALFDIVKGGKITVEVTYTTSTSNGTNVTVDSNQTAELVYKEAINEYYSASNITVGTSGDSTVKGSQIKVLSVQVYGTVDGQKVLLFQKLKGNQEYIAQNTQGTMELTETDKITGSTEGGGGVVEDDAQSEPQA